MKAERTILSAIVVAGLASVATAATWTGTNDSTWTDVANWGGGPVPGAAVFSGAPTANQPSMGAGRAITSLAFDTAGWNISGSGFTLTVASNSFVHSNGAGTNTVDANLTFSGNSGTSSNLTIGDDNTLIVTGNISMGGGAGKSMSGGINKTGTLVVNGSLTGLPDAQRPFSVFSNSPTSIGLASSHSFATGRGFGGTVPTVSVNNTNFWAPGTGTFLSPGYDPTTPISTMSFVGPGTNGSGVNLINSKLIMDIGTTLGDNDQIIAGNFMNRSSGGVTGFGLNGAELALRGTTIADGNYTLITETGTGQYSGTFGSMTFNGVAANPSNFLLTYSATSVVLSVTGMGVPEPTALAFLSVGALLMGRRRRVA